MQISSSIQGKLTSCFQGTIEDIAKFETKLAAVLPPSKAFDQGDMSGVLQKQESDQQTQVMHTGV